MSSKTLSLFFILSFFLVPGFAYGQTATSPPVPTSSTAVLPSTWQKELRQERRQLIKNQQEIRKDARELYKNPSRFRPVTPPVGTVTPRPQNKKVTRLTATYNRLLRELSGRKDSLLASKTKIQSRLTAAKTAGVDVTLAQAKLDSFSLTSYDQDLSAFKAEFNRLIALDTGKYELGTLRSLASKVSRDLTSMRQILADSLRLLIKASR